MSGTEVARKPRNHKRSPYNEFEIEQGLQAVALSGGNTRAAERLLKDQGVSIPHPTLRDWVKYKKVAEYERVRDEVAPKLFAKIGEQNLHVAEQATKLEVEFLDKLAAALAAGEIAPKELAGALRNVSVTKSIAVDKASVISGRPTDIRVNADSVQDALRKIQRRFGHAVTIAPAILDALDVKAEEVEVKEEK